MMYGVDLDAVVGNARITGFTSLAALRIGDTDDDEPVSGRNSPSAGPAYEVQHPRHPLTPPALLHRNPNRSAAPSMPQPHNDMGWDIPLTQQKRHLDRRRRLCRRTGETPVPPKKTDCSTQSAAPSDGQQPIGTSHLNFAPQQWILRFELLGLFPLGAQNDHAWVAACNGEQQRGQPDVLLWRSVRN